MAEPKLVRYIRECESLVADLRNLIGDLSFKAEQPDAVIYAVDFSEVFAYAFPDKISGQLKLFHNEPAEATAVHQRFVLHKLFSPDGDQGAVLTDNPVALLDPYALELRNFVRRTGPASASEFASDYVEASRELDRMLSDQQFGMIRDQARELLENPQPPESAYEQLLSYFERQAPHLVVSIDRASAAVGSRLTGLLERQRMRGLGAWDPGFLPVDDERQARWDQALYEARNQRDSGACFVDAKALALIHAANKVFAAQGRRLLLITRSTTMHTLVKEELESGDWGEPAFNPLRHPRYLIPLHTVEGQSLDVQLRDLKGLLRSVDLFLATYRDVNVGDGGAYEEDMERIRVRLRNSAALSTWLTTASLALEGAQHLQVETRERLRMLVEVSTNRGSFKQHIIKRIAELETELERLYTYSGVALHVADDQDAGDPTASLTAVQLKDRLIVTSARPEMPYTLQFESQTLKDWSERVVLTDRIDVGEVLNLLRASFDATSEYEVLLFIACVFGAWRHWDLALRYCDFALSKHRHADPPAHEGVFFRALCLRMQDPPTPDRFTDAVNEIDRAMAIKQAARGEDYAGDPRYMKEKAAILFFWHDLASGPNRLFAITPPAPIDEAVTLSERALARIRDDWRLKAQVYNNLCFHYLDAPTAQARDRAQHYLVALDALLRDYEPDPRKWPPSQLDTVVWADYRLNRIKSKYSAAQLSEMVALLDHVLSVHGLPKHIQGSVLDHRLQIARQQKKAAALADTTTAPVPT